MWLRVCLQVAFGASGRNLAKPVVTTQVLDGSVQVVLPAEAATAQLVVPTPRPHDNKVSQHARLCVCTYW